MTESSENTVKLKHLNNCHLKAIKILCELQYCISVMFSYKIKDHGTLYFLFVQNSRPVLNVFEEKVQSLSPTQVPWICKWHFYKILTYLHRWYSHSNKSGKFAPAVMLSFHDTDLGVGASVFFFSGSCLFRWPWWLHWAPFKILLLLEADCPITFFASGCKVVELVVSLTKVWRLEKPGDTDAFQPVKCFTKTYHK